MFMITLNYHFFASKYMEFIMAYRILAFVLGVGCRTWCRSNSSSLSCHQQQQFL